MSYKIKGTEVFIDASTLTEEDAARYEEDVDKMEKITRIVIKNQNLKDVRTLGQVTPYSKEKMKKFFDAQCVAMGAQTLEMNLDLDMGTRVKVKYNYKTGKIKYSGLLGWAIKFGLSKRYPIHHKLYNMIAILTRKLDLELVTLEKAWNTIPAANFHPEAFVAIGVDDEVLSV